MVRLISCIENTALTSAQRADRMRRQDKHGNAHPQLRWVEESNPLDNDAIFFEVLNSMPACVLREVDLFGNVRERLRRVGLQTLQDSAIRAVQSRHGKITHQVQFV